MIQWFNTDSVIHSFADNSGTVFFHKLSGETLALNMPLSSIFNDISDPSSQLRLDDIVMNRLRVYLSDSAQSQLGLVDVI